MCTNLVHMSPPSSLSSYPQPSVTVDVALLTVDTTTDRNVGDRLKVLVQQRSRSPRGLVMPGRFVRKGETFADAVRATLSEKVGIEDAVAEPRLIKIYDDPRRDQRGWVMSALHVLALPVPALADPRGDLLAVEEAGRMVDRRHLFFYPADIPAPGVQRRPPPDD